MASKNTHFLLLYILIMCKAQKSATFAIAGCGDLHFKINFNIFVEDNFIGHLKFIII